MNYEHLLSIMKKYGYEIKEGKHIAFKAENQKRFTRAKTIGENYTEERIRERIKDRLFGKTELEDIIDVKDEKIKDKMQNSVAYDRSITHQNMQIASQSLNVLNKANLLNYDELERELKRMSFDLNECRKDISDVDTEQSRMKDVIKDFRFLIAKKQHYEGYLKNPNDKIYMFMNGKDVDLYKESYERVDLFLKQFPHLKKIINIDKVDKSVFKKLNSHSKKLSEKQSTMVDEYNVLIEKYHRLSKAKNNLDIYMGDKKKKEKKLSWVESMRNLPNHDENRGKSKAPKKKTRNEMEL